MVEDGDVEVHSRSTYLNLKLVVVVAAVVVAAVAAVDMYRKITNQGCVCRSQECIFCLSYFHLLLRD